jgi:DNA-binding transcriptional LysR family regulator
MTLPERVADLMPFDLLLSVARLGSLGLAAQAHGISQPAASTRIRRLERRLGVTLIERSPHGSRLTPHGELVVGWAQAAVNAAAALEAGITSLRERSDAVLRVVASMTIAEYLLPGWLTALRGLDPATTVTLTAGNSAAVADAVLAGTADLGFVEGPDRPADILGHAHGRGGARAPVGAAPVRDHRRRAGRDPAGGQGTGLRHAAVPGGGAARPSGPGTRAPGGRTVVDDRHQVRGRRGDRPRRAQLARGSPRARRGDVARGPGDRP